MRADAHYVDLLSSRTAGGRDRLLSTRAIDAPPLVDPAEILALVESVRRHGVLQPLIVQERRGSFRLISGHKRLSAAIAAGVDEVPCRVHDVSDEEASRMSEALKVGRTETAPPALQEQTPAQAASALHADADLEKSLRTLHACADLIAKADAPLPRAVVGNLIRSEAFRAVCLLQGVRLVREPQPVARVPMSAASVIDQVAQAFAPEKQLRGLEIETTSNLPYGPTIVGDEGLLTRAVSCALFATVSVLENVTGAKVSLGAAADAVGGIAFTVSQNAIAVPDAWFSRAFDETWTDRPGGIPALVSMLAVQRAADILGGRVVAKRHGRGTVISISVPMQA
jgi:ParB-like chromosome segregation protein Spo0J